MKVQDVALANIANKITDSLGTIDNSKMELIQTTDASKADIMARGIMELESKVHELQETYRHIRAVGMVGWSNLDQDDKTLIRKYAEV
jgi:hypothetical protein